jgi:hypothetical protein
MKKFIILIAAMAIVTAQSAFAKNLGALPDAQQPKNLVSASEFLKYISSPEATHYRTPEQNNNVRSHVRWDDDFGDRCDSFDNFGPYGYWGGFFPGAFPLLAFPFISPSFFLPPIIPTFGYGYGYPFATTPWYGSPFYWADESGDTTANQTQITRDAAHAPVVCFASDASGNWYANADIASNVDSTQKNTNDECLKSGAQCSQNLGCAVVRGVDTNNVN